MENRRSFVKKLGWTAGAVSLLGLYPAFGWSPIIERKNPIRIKGRVATNGKGIGNVVVSDGNTTGLTNKNGYFEFLSTTHQPFVFLSMPAGYEIDQLSNGSASYFFPIDPANHKMEVLFQLKPLGQSDDKHSLLLLADPQIQNEYEAAQLLEISTPDIVDTIKSLNDPNTIGVGCGDLVFDRLDLFKDYNNAVMQMGVPFFQVVGNHDMDLGVRSDELSTSTFNKLFGPTYYSFNRGEIHYVVLDDVFFTGNNKEYIGYITENQLIWLEQDLGHIEKGSTVVVCTHIPVASGVKNKEHLYELLAPFKVHILSGHTHRNTNYPESNRFEHVHGAVCGAWWSGPICSDGTPNGYGVYQMRGSEVTWKYKSVGESMDHQFRFYKRGSHPEFPNSCALNIWNWNPDWKICWYENGDRKSHIHKVDATDPMSIELHLGKLLPERRPWVEPAKSDHMFFFEPGENLDKITIEVTDNFGNTYIQTIKSEDM
ncbi:calcineurin-like phosphoesterase C-terminal domain-containing protein [Flagellimonas marinaquae]|uniref:calcineurin-like phosphoesterase C-terminal domain-containing protein n=1 Tax=Flagellimonas marinaquae TaxID=254955 RepID=UPI0020766528|nr:calcineurin-like phosphoesterase family protein [Allomuricauda aquimarina]USD24747.1 calcineurin-like phosphoesterase family protein [Allomuricauda aquimarina]